MDIKTENCDKRAAMILYLEFIGQWFVKPLLAGKVLATLADLRGRAARGAAFFEAQLVRFVLRWRAGLRVM